MSIALSVALQPSRYVRRCLIGFVLVLWLQGIWLLTRSDLPRQGAGALSLALFVASAWVWYAGRKILQACHLTISPSGQIVMTLENVSACVVRLHAATVLWPQALFLRLQDAKGTIYSVLVLADCLAASELCALLVSCRWVMARDKPEKNCNSEKMSELIACKALYDTGRVRIEDKQENSE